MIFNNLFTALFALFLTLLPHQQLTAEPSVEHIKGTSSILKPEYQHLSPVHGGLWWTTNYIENLYRFGNGANKTKPEAPVALAPESEAEFIPVALNGSLWKV